MPIKPDQLNKLINKGCLAVENAHSFHRGEVEFFIAEKLLELRGEMGDAVWSGNTLRKHRGPTYRKKEIDVDILNKFVYVCVVESKRELGKDWAERIFAANDMTSQDMRPKVLSLFEDGQKVNDKRIRQKLKQYFTHTNIPIFFAGVVPNLVKFGSADNTGSITIEELLGKTETRNIYIYGPPGSGKTFLWRYSTGYFLKENEPIPANRAGRANLATSKAQRLPIPINLELLDELRAGQTSLFSMAVTQWREPDNVLNTSELTQEEWNAVPLALKTCPKESVCLLIDNLDKVKNNSPVLQLLEQDLHVYPYVMFTHQPMVFATSHPEPELYEIAPFSPQQQKDFIAEWFTKQAKPNPAQQLISELQQSDPIIRNFIEWPGHLEIVCDYFERYNTTLPKNLPVLIREAVARILESTAQRILPFDVCGKEKLYDTLSTIALYSYLTFDRRPREMILYEYEFADLKRITALSEEQLSRFLQYIKVLIKLPRQGYQNEKFTFGLPIFREYLTAETIRSMGNEATELISLTIERQDWRNVRRIYNLLRQESQ